MYQEVHVVNAANAQHYQTELIEFFRIRHDIYVIEKGWRPAASDCFEFDQYDTDAATYLIGLDEKGRVITGSRFVPTDLPHLLLDIFPHAVSRRIEDRTVGEWTRGFIVPHLRESGGISIKAHFCAAVQEWGLREGIGAVGGIQEIYWLPLWKRLGWTVNIIGDRLLIDDEWCVAAYFDVSEEAYAKTKARAKLTVSNLRQRGTCRPFEDMALGPGRSVIETIVRG